MKLIAVAEAVLKLHVQCLHTFQQVKLKVPNTAFAVISSSSADFLMMSHQLSSLSSSVVEPSPSGKKGMQSPIKDAASIDGILALELAKLYKVILPYSSVSNRELGEEWATVYAVLTIEEVAALCVGGWRALLRIKDRQSMVLSNDAGE